MRWKGLFSWLMIPVCVTVADLLLQLSELENDGCLLQVLVY